MEKTRTDLDLSIFCNDCGIGFRRTLGELPANMEVRCPCCYGSALVIKGDGDLTVEAEFCDDGFDHADADTDKPLYMSAKIKL